MAPKARFGTEQLARLAEISESALGELRLREPAAVDKLKRSLRRHGQLEPLVVFAQGELLEVLDGFKRLDAARQLAWAELTVRVAEVDPIAAKLLLLELHGRRGLSALEEAWLVRSLYRVDGLSQGAIGARLGRHKSWVCRRLLLAEQVDSSVQADVRLGLLAPKAAVALAALPRGNQKAAADVVSGRGLTVSQTALLVGELSRCNADEAARILSDWADGKHAASAKLPHPVLSEADWIAQDITTLRKVAARLQARLLSTPPSGLGEGTEQVIRRGLESLLPVLGALTQTVGGTVGGTASEDAA